jgi:hypothetical protein
MAQAARQQGYNNGRDEFGRRIRQPNGIDIADGAFWDDLGMTDSDWVDVTFLWLGADPFVATGDQTATDRAVIEPDAIVVDDAAEGYVAVDGRNWQSADCGIGGSHAWSYDTPGATARSQHRAVWTPPLQGEGFYEALAFIPACGPTPTEHARYTVIHNGAVSEVVINHAAASGGWVSLGVFHMGPGSSVMLTNQTGSDGRAVHFDAIKWRLRDDVHPPDAAVVEAASLPEGGIRVRWDGEDDVAASRRSMCRCDACRMATGSTGSRRRRSTKRCLLRLNRACTPSAPAPATGPAKSRPGPIWMIFRSQRRRCRIIAYGLARMGKRIRIGTDEE